jgi:hypothetical protein
MRYDRDAIERALKLHSDAGLIGEWGRRNDLTDATGHWIVTNNFAPIQTRSLRETWLVVAGLASAHKAMARRDRLRAEQTTKVVS